MVLGIPHRKTCHWTMVLAALLATAQVSLASELFSLQGDPAIRSISEDSASIDTEKPSLAKPPWRTFEFLFGASYNAINSSITLERKGGIASFAVEPEQGLGLEDDVFSPEVWTAIRFWDRHRLQFSFTGSFRSATETLGRDIVFNGKTYFLGTSVHTDFDFEFYNLSYVWSFFQDDRMDLGVSIGLDVIFTHFSIEAGSLKQSEDDRLTIPIPLPGFNFDFALRPNLWIRQRLTAMYISVSQYGALVVDFNMALEWSFMDHLAVGIGGTFSRVQLRMDSNAQSFGNLTGEIKYNTAGLLLYLNLYF
jgi:hypothetical protein